MFKIAGWNDIKQKVGYFVRLNQMSVDTMLSSHVNVKNGAIVFFGDSRAKAWFASPGISPLNSSNRGISLDTSAQSLKRFDKHVGPTTRYIVMQVGVNDFKPISFSPFQKETIIGSCKQNISDLSARSLRIGATILLTTIFPIGREVPVGFGRFWLPDVAHAIDDVNQHIRSLELPNLVVLDAFSILSDENGFIRDDYAADSLHVNSAGYAALNKELTAVLAALDTDTYFNGKNKQDS